MAAAPDLNFKVTIAKAGDALVIDYRLENGTSQPVFVTNKIWRIIEGKAKIDPDFVYSRMMDGKILALSKTMPEIPSGRSPTNLVAPYMTKIDPGKMLAQTVNIPLPVQTYVEYFSNAVAKDDNGNPLTEAASEAVFQLGYFLPPEGSRIWAEQAFGEEVDLFHNPPGKRAAYGVLTSQKIRVPVPVFRRAAN
jgi:hypothetical protein